MSSEGSVISTASRIRQFGLYRTIDARTEEFLRSSRRRQIRQGCACAAISTAITVTVVVSVILVYEYSINSASNLNKKISAKPNWLALMNDSDSTQADLKFEKKKFDRTTLKLLPILIKALNKNRYLEKIIEDYTSSSPSYEGKSESENYFQRNIFSNTKNWLKLPSSKSYTADYKSLPLVYTLRPPPDYLSRIRKIRNYKMMLNYFDKMVSERVSYSKPSQTQKPDFGNNESSVKMTTVDNATNTNKRIAVENTLGNKSRKTFLGNLTNNNKIMTKDYRSFPNFQTKKPHKNQVHCKCPKDMGLLLTRLLQNIKEVIPKISNRDQVSSLYPGKNKSISFKEEIATKSTATDVLTELTSLKSTTPETKTAKRDENHESIIDLDNKKVTTTTQTTTIGLQKTSEILTDISTVSTKNPNIVLRINTNFNSVFLSNSSSKNNTYSTTDIPVDKPNATVENKQNFEAGSMQSSKYIVENIPMYGNYDIQETNYESTTNINKQDLTKSHSYINTKSQETTTELILPLKLTSHSDEASLSSESFLDSVAIIPNYKHPIVPLFKDNEYDDYILTTRAPKNHFEDLDVHSFELVKTKNIISNHIKIDRNMLKANVKNFPIYSKKYYPVVKNKNTDHISMRKMADLIHLPKLLIQQTNAPKFSPIYENEGSSYSNYTTREDKETGFLKNVVKIQNPERVSEKRSEIPTQSFSNTEAKQVIQGDQGNNENTNEEELPEEWIKDVEVTDDNNIRYNKSIYEDDSSTVSQNNLESKYYDKINSESLKSMLPSIRPIYLEIRRNGDWKPEDHANYDFNLANNIFDLPDI